MSDTPDRPSDLSRIFDEYLVRCQCGESPSLDEYCRRYPDLAEQLRLHVRLYDALGEIEPAKDDPASEPGADAHAVALLPALKTVPTAEVLSRQQTAGLPDVPGYAVEALLGRGGMGVVYKARHLALKRTVALKMVAARHPHPAEQARFRAEAEAVARLQHPNIVQIHEIGEADGRPFFALEYVAGGSLAERLAGKFIPPLAAARLVAMLAEAMHLAHSRNLVHRDLKPANVLLVGEAGTTVDQCQPKVTDFGLVRQLDADSGQTFDGAVLGTPSYMAPEQAEGRASSAGPAADVYALGAILYECLTGRPPFVGATAQETLEQVRSREPAPPSSLNRQTPRDVETICLKCLRKQPEDRYSSARELGDDLARFVRGEPVAARPIGVAERLRKWVCRRPATAGLLAAVVLLATVGGIGAWLLYQQRITTQVRQAQTDQEVNRILEVASIRLEEGWQAADLEKIKAARADSSRAEDVARNGGASPTVLHEATALRERTNGLVNRAEKNRTLLEALLEVLVPQETPGYQRDPTGGLTVLPLPNFDVQYTAAFRAWGLDVDGTAEADVVARLGAEPDPVVQELIAALDNWMMERRRQKRPEEQWKRLFRVAEQLDHSERHRRLRTLLVGTVPPRAESIAGLVGLGSPWLAPWELTRGSAWRSLLEVQQEIDPRTEPVLTVLLLAQGFAEVGDLARAEQILRQADAARPGQVVLLGALGKLLWRQGRSRVMESIGYFRAARSHRPHLGAPLSGALLRAGRPTEAKDLMQELVYQHPENPVFHFYLGIVEFERREYASAEAAFRKAIERKPDYAEAYNNLGSSLTEQRRFDAAEAAYRHAIELKPRYADAYCGLGNTLAGQQKSGVEAAYRKAIEYDPDITEAYNRLSNILREQGKYAEAEEAYRKLVALDPGFFEAWRNFGGILFAQQKYGEAVIAFHKAIDLQPDRAETYGSLGSTLAAQGNYPEAAAAYRKAIDRKSEDYSIYYNLGITLLAQSKFAEAEAAYRKAIEYKPDLPQALHGLGRVLFLQQKLVEAEAPLRKAIAISPGFGMAHFDLGAVLREQNRFDDAAASFKKASDLLPAKLDRQEQALRMQRQCQRYAILDRRLPAILQGTDKPADTAERIDLAALCRLKKKYAAAMGFFRNAFAADPPLAEDLTRGVRYDAACAAALAGCDRSNDTNDMDDKERLLCRRQALEWLRQDLVCWNRAFEARDQQMIKNAGKTLRHWQEDSDLAGVRGKDLLARLPVEERMQWDSFWSEVDALLRRCNEIR